MIKKIINFGLVGVFATAIEYILLIVLKEFSKTKEMTGFFITAIIGLGINQVMMYILVDTVKIYYLFAKVISTGTVMIWNFISRHVFLEG